MRAPNLPGRRFQWCWLRNTRTRRPRTWRDGATSGPPESSNRVFRVPILFAGARSRNCGRWFQPLWQQLLWVELGDDKTLNQLRMVDRLERP